MFGLPKETINTPKRNLRSGEVAALKDAIIELSEVLISSRDKDEDEIPTKDAKFIKACLQQTDNIQPRKTRFDILYKNAFGS